MAPTLAPFDLNFAGSGSAPAPLQTKICYKSLIFMYRKSISITAEPKKNSFLSCKIISKIIIFKKILRLLELGAALIYASSDSIPTF